MNLIELKCKHCGAMMKVNSELTKVTCNYCGTTALIEDENQTKVERIIKQLGKEIDKSREYHNSKEFKEEQEKDFKRMGIMIGGYALLMIILIVIFKIL